MRRRRALWVATGVAGLTGVVGLAALGGLAARENKADDAQQRADQQAATARQNVSDAGPGAEEAAKDDTRRGSDWDAREAKDRYDAKDEHGRVREVPCDDDKLVEALDLANRDHGGTIKLAEHCTYELDFADKKSGGALPTIKQEITIKGNDATIKRDSEDAFRLFRVADGGDLTLKDLTLTGGNAAEFKYGQIPGGPGVPGGAGGASAAPSYAKPQTKEGEADGGALLVEHGGSAHLKKVTLTRNNAEGNGGAIANYGRVDIEHSKIADNHARENGGGIFNLGLLHVEDSKIVNNTAGENGGGVANGRGKDRKGGYPFVEGRDKVGSVEIVDTSVEGNRADRNGGGVFSSGGFVKITGEGRDHEGGWGGGAADAGQDQRGDHRYAAQAVVKGNNACDSGGGIYAHHTDLDLRHVLVVKNHAGQDGGGIVVIGDERRKATAPGGEGGHTSATVADSAVVENTAGRFGGGIFNGEPVELRTLPTTMAALDGPRDGEHNSVRLTLRDTWIKGNTAVNGGGIFTNAGTVTLSRTKVTENTATGVKEHWFAGGLDVSFRLAGGILNDGGEVRLDDESTVTDNDPSNCAGTVENCFH
ncbi:hypothetical protein [Micromonospora siamensis]|uniref:hypothetical protein n=1 Tax=Micromonospora siamensis TaxID=299152 RepID=UPI001E3FC393|nr:hypothetical protein [Micromonospora siamensis]